MIKFNHLLKSKRKSIFTIIIISLILIGGISFLDKALAIGIIFVIFLTGITFLVLSKIGILSKRIILLFLIVLLIHFAATLFIHYTQFYPFGGGEGDQIVYQQLAVNLSQDIHQGNFSLSDLNKYTLPHYYSILIGMLYTITLPEMIIGKLLNVWLVAISIIFTYLMVLEVGGSKKWAFLIGLIVCLYPSYLYFGSMLLRESLVVSLALFGMLFCLKLIKSFSWQNFLIFYLILGALIHFRFYIGFSLIFTFISCWLLLSNLNFRKRVIYGIIIIPILGFLPQFSGYGYYGIDSFRSYLNIDAITFYREVIYNPAAYIPSTPSTPQVAPTYLGSSVIVETGSENPLRFFGNSLKSFSYVLLGPFPWQMKYSRHLMALFETFPWYILLFFVIKGILKSIKREYKVILPVIFFSFGVFAIIALFIDNFGIYMRIRMPAFIVLTCLIPLVFKRQDELKVLDKNRKIKICYVTNKDISIKFTLLNQLKLLQNEGYEVFAVCSAGKFIKSIEEQGIRVKTINFKRKISPFSDLICLFRLFFYFRKEKFDIVHTHTPKPGLLGQLAAKVAGIPIVVNTVHGFYFQENSPFFKKRFFIFIEKIAAKCSNIIFSIDREDVKTAIKEKICSRDLIKYLGDGIDINRFNPERFSDEFVLNKKKQLGIGPEKKNVGIIARLVKEKGYLDLFEAFKKVLKIFPETVLLIVGPREPEKKDAISYDIVKNYDIEKNVIFLGQRTDVEKIYPLMDIFVLPSHREGLGLVILEASAMEKAVVATDIRGCREAVEDNKTGILVPVRNPEKLAEAIIYLLRNPEKAKEMGKNGRKKIEREFDENLVFDKIKTEYKVLIEEKLT